MSGSWVCPCGGTECLIPPSQYVCNQGETGSPTCGQSGWYCNHGGSPIIIDTSGQGFHLTDKAHGVVFTFFPGQPAIKISWTDPSYGNGFLVLDRNADGIINDATELFGDLTQQPPSDTPNGYAALAVFDNPMNGGNGNGVIDAGDQVFDKLRLWIDENHDGVSQPEELHKLKDIGILQIDLKYVMSRYTDAYGNQFRYRSRVKYVNRRTDHQTYDVFLQYDKINFQADLQKSENNFSPKQCSVSRPLALSQLTMNSEKGEWRR